MYFYPLESTNGSFDNPLRRDSDARPITLSGDIHAALPYKEFNYIASSSGIYLDFIDTILCSSEEGVVNDAIETHVNHAPSPIEDLNNNWATQYSDYKQARSALAVIAYVSGFNNMTWLEKQITTKWFVLPAEQRNQVYGFDDQLKYGIRFHEHSMDARDKRLKATALVVYNLLPKNQVMEIVSDMGDLPTMYVRFGKEGTVEGDGVGFFDFMLARAGTPYETTGLLIRDYTPIEGTMSDMVDTCMKILKSGIYPI